MFINNPKLSATQAADQFARDNWPEANRQVDHNTFRDAGRRGVYTFKLVQGVKTYRLEMMPHGYEIVDAE